MNILDILNQFKGHAGTFAAVFLALYFLSTGDIVHAFGAISTLLVGLHVILPPTDSPPAPPSVVKP